MGGQNAQKKSNVVVVCAYALCLDFKASKHGSVEEKKTGTRLYLSASMGLSLPTSSVLFEADRYTRSVGVFCKSPHLVVELRGLYV